MTSKQLYIIAILSCLCVAGGLYVFKSNTNNPAATASTNDNNENSLPSDKIEEIQSFFVKESIIKAPEIVDCTLSGGTKTQCFTITVKTTPSDFTTGPWCPRHIEDSAEKGGKWIKDGQLFDVDGAFIKNLATFYNDDVWQMYDPETGDIFYTKTAAACAAAARPDVDPQYYNHCVECRPDFMDDGASMSYTIPITPVPMDRPENRPPSGIGISFSGAKIETAAPLDAILDAHTLAAFDDCGGHVNLNVGYHIHAVTGCVKEVDIGPANHAAMIGYAMDGHPLYMKNNKDGTEPSNLDECRGHDSENLGYHYHVADPGTNAILPCLKAQSGCASNDLDAECDASARKGPPR